MSLGDGGEGVWDSLSPCGLPTRPEKGGQAGTSFGWDSTTWTGDRWGAGNQSKAGAGKEQEVKGPDGRQQPRCH